MFKENTIAKRQELLDGLFKTIKDRWRWNPSTETIFKNKVFKEILFGEVPFTYKDIADKIYMNRRIILNDSSKDIFDFLELALSLKDSIHSYGKFIKRFYVDINIMGYIIQISYDKTNSSIDILSNVLDIVYLNLYQMFYAIVNQKDISIFHSDMIDLEFGVKYKLNFYNSY